MPVESFGSGEDPFKPTPDPRYLYFNAERQRTYDALTADIRGGRRCILLLGGSGMGKTTLLWKLRQDLGASEFQVIFPSYTRLSYEELLESCRELGAEGLGEKNGLRSAPPDNGEVTAGRRPFLILIDEAQVVSDETLERLCQLCEGPDGAPAQVLFAGQPELAERLSASRIEAVRRCAEAPYRLDRLDDRDTTAYIYHRLKVAGAEEPEVFETPATDRVARLAGGVPRLINRLSGTSLRMARDRRADRVSADIVDLAAAICDPVPGDKAVTSSAGEGTSDRPAAANGRPKDGQPGNVLSLMDKIASAPGAKPGGVGGRAPTARGVASPGAQPVAAAGALGSPAKTRRLTFTVGGFVAGALIGAAVMIGFLLATRPSGQPILDRLKLSALWQSVHTPPVSDPWPTPGQAASSAESITPSGGLPLIVASAASGVEDQPLDLDIGVSFPGSRAGAQRTVDIDGLPPGGALSAGQRREDGRWRLRPEETAGLQFIPPADFSGGFALEVMAVAQQPGESGRSARITYAGAGLPVSVAGVADPARLTVADAGGKTGEPIPLTIGSALADRDGSERLTIEIRGLPPGSTLSAGTPSPEGLWRLAPDQLADLTVTAPLGSSGTVELEIRAIAEESDGDRAVTVAGATLELTPNVRAPLLTAAEARGEEDSPIALEIGVATEDLRGVEGLTIALSGLPAGASLSAGKADATGVWHLEARDLAGLSLLPPDDYSGRFALAVAAGVPGFAEVESSTSFEVAVAARADRPDLNVEAARGREDQPIPLRISAGLVDGDGSEALTLSLAGLPEGARLSAGTPGEGSLWLLRAEDLDGLTLLPAADRAGTFELTVTARSREAGGEEAVRTMNLPVVVAAVADQPTLEVGEAGGFEDEPIGLEIAAALTDIDGSESLSLSIAGLPEGVRLSAGRPDDGNLWWLRPEELEGLTLIPAANRAEAFELTVTARSREAGGGEATRAARLPVTVAAVADPPTLEVAEAVGPEDEPLALGIAAVLADADGSESLSLSISGLPAGARLSHGQAAEDGTWALSPAELDQVSLLPPENLGGDFILEVAATATESAGDRATVRVPLPVTLIPVADRPSLSLAPAHGLEDQPLVLPIEAGLTDLDGSERLMVVVEGLPEGFRLSAGARAGPGEPWVLSAEQLESLALIGRENASGSFALTVTAMAQEAGREPVTSTVGSLEVRLDPVADTPRLTAADLEAREDEPVALRIEAGLGDRDGSESLSLELRGLPEGARLSAGRAEGGVWRLTPDETADLTLVPPPDFSGRIPLSIRARAVEEGGESAFAEASMVVAVRGVADRPRVVAEGARGLAGRPLDLTIAAASGDPDGSETLTIEVAGLPEGARLNKGEARPDGSWHLAPEDLVGLTVIPGARSTGRFSLQVTVRAVESDGDINSATMTMALEVLALKDTLAVEVAEAAGREDEAVPLKIAVVSRGADPVGGMPVFIAGLPEGAALSAGVEEAAGQWRLEPGQLEGLELLTPSDFSGSMTLTVSVGREEEDGDQRPSAVVSVTVSPVADPPELAVAEARGTAGEPLPLEIASALSDLDGSETLSLEVSGLPEGARLNAGVPEGEGTWRLSAEDLTGLTLVTPHTSAGRFELSVVAWAREAEGPPAKAAARMAVNLETPVPETAAPAVTTPILPVEALGEAEPPVPEASAPKPAADKALDLDSVSEATTEKLGATLTATATPAPAPGDKAEPGPAGQWIERGDHLLSLGDIASARLFYELAVQQGSAKAATAMGRTYDPAFLKEREVIGIPGDSAMATQWYRRALEAGDPEAKILLDALPVQP